MLAHTCDLIKTVHEFKSTPYIPARLGEGLRRVR